MNAVTICLCSAKGGTGKTAIAVSLAVLLSNVGKRVVVVDADAATNGMSLLMLKSLVEAKRASTTTGLFDKNAPIPIRINERLQFVPSSSSMRDTTLADEGLVKEHLQYIKGQLASDEDVIILDAQAGTEHFARVAIEMANKVVIVTEFDPMSATGVQRLRDSFPGVWPTGQTYVLVNKMLPDFSKIEREYFTAFDHLSPIPFDSEVMRAYARGEIPMDLGKANLFATAIIRMTRTLLPEYQEDIQDWVAKQVEELRRPKRRQLEDVSQEMANVEDELVTARVGAQLPGEYAPLSRMLARLGISYNLAITLGYVTACIYLILFGLFIWFQLNNEGIGQAIFITGLSVTVVGASYWFTTRARRRVDELRRREQAALHARQLERQLDRLFEQKDKLESLLATEPEEYLASEQE